MNTKLSRGRLADKPILKDVRKQAPSNVSERSGFGALSWLGANGCCLEEGDGSLALVETRLKQTFAVLCTPPWALHGDLSGTRQEQLRLREKLEQARISLAVVDLGPRALDCLQPPNGWAEVIRHTRQIQWISGHEPPLPPTRLKQERRFLREGGQVHISADDSQAWKAVRDLHATSRERKGLSSHSTKLEALLDSIANEPWTFTSIAVNAQGTPLASGGFVMLQDGTCVYSFGGQLRSKESGRASVAMLLAAVRHASQLGCTRFDFGGSQDDGVDQFYAEFGAEVVLLRRWLKAPWWFGLIFPRTWKSWSQASRHR